MFGARMHWLIAPFDPGCRLTYGNTSVLLHLVPRLPRRDLEVLPLRYRVKVPGRLRARVLVRRAGRPVSGAHVSLAGAVAAPGRAGGRGSRCRWSWRPLPGAGPPGPRLRAVGLHRPAGHPHGQLAIVVRSGLST